MACPKCHESRYWSPETGCYICNRIKTGEKYDITLTDEELKMIQSGGFVENTLFSRHMNILVVIQKEGD